MLKKYLAEILTSYLSNSLVTKLAKDLEGEYYPYYPRMLSCVLPLVYHQDIKLLEVSGFRQIIGKGQIRF